MKRLALLSALLCAVLLTTSERAAAQVALNETPAVISGGVGWYDIVQQDDQAVDFRLEYRHGEDFLWLKPWGGIEATSDGSVWGGIGVLMDITFFDTVVLTGSIAPGLYEDGDGKDLGSVFEIRSQVELGYQFENQSRLAVSFSHTSNASVADDNPGVEVLNLYYHLPLDVLF
ncbi:acyloxyacyl hydrolase [Pelagibius marinus]|uniref:acyloxyacyl hydrolase n=1 Tax=Pelagibius marinus TaxID=2762760 RepID=UPI001872F7D7|nr:acyloxyacyl hydrolase [Pelagibius marinus]